MTGTFVLFILLFINISSFPSLAFHSSKILFRLSKVSLFSTAQKVPAVEKIHDLQFPLGRIAFSLLPFSPESAGRRKTLLTTIISDKIWTLDQIQGVLHVNVPVRCTIIALKSGGLFINNPVAPTKEAIDYIRDLEKRFGPVKYLILSSLAVEHKGTIGAVSNYFPSAEIFVQPGQYSFPLNLPVSFFFPAFRKIQEIPVEAPQAPWYDEIDHLSIGPLKPKKSSGGFGETAFFHRDTQSLLVTDSLIRVEDDPPPILQDDPRSLLYHARDSQLDTVTDTPEIRRKGWRRISLFALVFQPSGIKVNELRDSIALLKQEKPEMRKLGRGVIPIDEGLYPWDWIEDEKVNFRALQRKDKGGLLVPPILQELIFNREPENVLDWVQNICKWKFKRIIPCHFANNVVASPTDVRRAYEFLFSSSKRKGTTNIFSVFEKVTPEEKAFEKDLKVLKDASKLLTQQGVLFPERYL